MQIRSDECQHGRESPNEPLEFKYFFKGMDIMMKILNIAIHRAAEKVPSDGRALDMVAEILYSLDKMSVKFNFQSKEFEIIEQYDPETDKNAN